MQSHISVFAFGGTPRSSDAVSVGVLLLVEGKVWGVLVPRRTRRPRDRTDIGNPPYPAPILPGKSRRNIKAIEKICKKSRLWTRVGRASLAPRATCEAGTGVASALDRALIQVQQQIAEGSCNSDQLGGIHNLWLVSRGMRDLCHQFCE